MKATLRITFGLIVSVALSFLALTAPPTAPQEQSSLAALVVPERVTPETLRTKYRSGTSVRVLVVPGHDDEYWGATYRNIREADLTLELGKLVRDRFAADPRFATFITRESGTYTEEFMEHFDVFSSLIWEFRDYVRAVFASAVSRGDVVQITENHHGFAGSEIVRRLYGINLWANENAMDVLVHVHFNDYPRARVKSPGRYTGFSIYIPESQFPNARVSRVLAELVKARLNAALTVSDYPQESAGVVEDQELIAVGSYGSLYPASLLLEYGYIYEPHIIEPELRAQLFPALADLTYRGVVDFFERSD